MHRKLFTLTWFLLNALCYLRSVRYYYVPCGILYNGNAKCDLLYARMLLPFTLKSFKGKCYAICSLGNSHLPFSLCQIVLRTRNFMKFSFGNALLDTYPLLGFVVLIYVNLGKAEKQVRPFLLWSYFASFLNDINIRENKVFAFLSNISWINVKSSNNFLILMYFLRKKHQIL